MSGRHTPGPWVVDYSERRGGNIVAASGPVANTRWFGITHKQVMEDYANAHVVAAAPDFLGLAPHAVDLLETYAAFIRTDVKADDLERHPYLPEIEHVISELRRAISKAASSGDVKAEDRGFGDA